MRRIQPHSRFADESRENPIGTPQWLTIFNDMVTLLMVFFVLLFSLGSMNFQRFRQFQNAMQSAMGVMHGSENSRDAIISDNSAAPETRPDPIRPEKRLDRLAETAELEAEYTPKGIQLILNDRLLFPSGSARLSRQGLQLLEKVGAAIKPFHRTIRVEGHTDDIPIETRRYPSNWELSAARAISVVKFFIDEAGFSPDMLSAAGYGASRPRTGNDSPEQRAKNRRVEITLAQPIPSSENQARQDNGGN